jgi:hypothetical protein
MMREKIRAAQTLLNAHLVAELECRQPPSAAIRLELAQEAEDLVHDVADLLDSLEAYITVCGLPGPVTPDGT